MASSSYRSNFNPDRLEFIGASRLVRSKSSRKSLPTFSEIDRDLKDLRHRKALNPWEQKVARIEELIEHAGGWIDLHDGTQIASFPVFQELGAELLEANPSRFLSQKYCPQTHKRVTINKKEIEMCPEFPMDQVRGVNQNKRDSDIEMIGLINQAYFRIGIPLEFDAATLEEWKAADTNWGKEVKSKEDAELPFQDPKFLGHFLPYKEISDKDPDNLNQPSPSGTHQPRSFFKNRPNSIGFRRAGIGERLYDQVGPNRLIVGASWFYPPSFLNFVDENTDSSPSGLYGSARLIRRLKKAPSYNDYFER